jgi:hypothetical protein
MPGLKVFMGEFISRICPLTLIAPGGDTRVNSHGCKVLFVTISLSPEAVNRTAMDIVYNVVPKMYRDRTAQGVQEGV